VLDITTPNCITPLLLEISDHLTHLGATGRDFQGNMSLTNALPADAAKAAKSASHTLATLPTVARNNALTAIHAALSASKEKILAANARDLTLAKKAAEDGELSLSIVSRLDLAKKGKWEDMLKGILDVRELEDPGMLPLFLCGIISNLKAAKLAKSPYEQSLMMI
jgi:hypothetical protein